MAAAIEVTPRFLFAEYGRTLVIRPSEGEDAEALFESICADFENTKVEQDSEGNVSIMAPTGGESSYQNSQLNMQLGLWAKQDGRGRAFDSNVLFILPDQSRLGPDGAWVASETLAVLPRATRRKFLPIVPEFVVELKSPSDHFSELKRKMQDWMRNGVQLGWLIDPDKRCILVYRQEIEAEVVRGLDLSGEGPLQGFTLDLRPIWEGLEL